MLEDPAEPALRPADAERADVLRRLDEAYAEGRLQAGERAERALAVARAQSAAELAGLVADLPAPGVDVDLHEGRALGAPIPPQAAATASADRQLWAIFSGAQRGGRWRPGATFSAVAVFGGCELDLREAVVQGGRLEVRAVAVFGGITLTVPPGTEVVLHGLSLFGGRSVQLRHPEDGSRLHLELTGIAVFGGVHVHERPLRPG